MARFAAVAVALVVVPLVGGCGRSGATRATKTATVTVLAAASLTEAFGGLQLGPDLRATYSFAGSQQLVAQVQAGAPADVVATADHESMDRLVAAGLVEAPRDFAANRLAIAAAPGNPKKLGGLADLARPGIKVVLADPSVPAGKYARQILDRAAVDVRPVSLELDVKSVVRKVASGDADAGIVYVTDATPGAGVDRVAIPDAANAAVTYPVAVVKATEAPAAARAFVDRLLGAPGRAALTAHGFQLP